jgi:hypothetical protein
VIRWDEILQLDRHKQRFLHLVHFAHRIHTKDHENNIHIACPSNPAYAGHKLNNLLGPFWLRVPDATRFASTFEFDVRRRPLTAIIHLRSLQDFDRAGKPLYRAVSVDTEF